MDTQSYLMSLGWAGPGHPLHPSAYKQKGHRGLAYNPNEVRTASTGGGLIKPLLVSRKANNLGLGKRAHEPQQGNEWWLKGFEKALGDIGKSESERSSGVSTPVMGTERKHAGLYTFFVRGQQIEGTIDENERGRRSRKRKSDAISSDDNDSSESTNPAKEFETVASFIAVRDKDEKKRHRRAKSTPQEEFKQAGEYFGIRDAASSNRAKLDKRIALGLLENEEIRLTPEIEPKKKPKPDALNDEEETVETKEERRERRRKRKADKESKTAAAPTPSRASDEEALHDDTAAKAARKAERRKRKAEKAALS